jgi:hypothetical protein
VLQCNRGRAPNALATRFLLIAASILAARKLAHWDRRPSPKGEHSDTASEFGRRNENPVRVRHQHQVE